MSVLQSSSSLRTLRAPPVRNAAMSFIYVVDACVVRLLSGLMSRGGKARSHKDRVNALLSLVFLENESSGLGW